jgi:zinc protease
VPGNAILVVAGDVTEAELRALVAKTYETIPAGTVPAGRPAFQPLPPIATDRVQITDGHLVTPGLATIYRLPSLLEISRRESAALSLLADILGSDTGRLRNELVMKGLAISASASYTPGFSGQFVVAATAAKSVSLADVEKAAANVVADVLSRGVSGTELEVERDNHLAGEVYSMDSQSGLAGLYGRWLVMGRTIEEIENRREEIKTVTVEDVNAVARKYLRSDLKVVAEGWPDTTAAVAPPAGTPPGQIQ